MAVDTIKLLLIKCSKDLAKSSLSTPSLSNKKNWLLSTKALVHKNGKSLELLAYDKLWDTKT